MNSQLHIQRKMNVGRLLIVLSLIAAALVAAVQQIP